MAEIVTPGGRPIRFAAEEPRKYPWDAWLDGEEHALRVGHEITEIARFRSALRMWTRKRGIRVRTWRRGEGVVVVQALAGDPPSGPARA